MNEYPSDPAFSPRSERTLSVASGSALSRRASGWSERMQAVVTRSMELQAGAHEQLSKQLEGAVQATTTLVEAVSGHVDRTHTSALALLDRFDRAAAEGAAAFAKVWRALDKTSQSQSALELQAARLQAAVEETSKILSAQKRLERIGERAHNLGTRIRIVAMNATIEAGRGSATRGGTIGVLAQEITGLAREVQHVGLEIQTAVTSLNTRVDDVVMRGVSEEAHAIGELGNVLGGSVQSLRESYQALSALQDEMRDQTLTAARGVVDNAHATIGGLQYEDIARQRVEQVKRALVAMSEKDRALHQAMLGEVDLTPELSSLLEQGEAKTSHTANRVRSIEADDADQDSDIELF